MSEPIWLEASYKFPCTYSIRRPGSSMTSAMALPAPGPGTVRLALTRTALELYGENYMA
jgi:hypothetical protein